MVNRLLKWLEQDIVGVHQAAYILGASAFLSQLLALIRDRMLASHFGAGISLDIYYSAFRVQDFIYFSITSLVSISVLLPLLIEALESSKEKGKRILDTLFTLFFVTIALVSSIAYICAPQIVHVLFPGLLGQGHDLELIQLTRILLLSPILFGLSNLLSSVTQAYGRFYIYAISPLVYNVGIIIGILAFLPVYGLSGLGYGVILGALMHFAIQVPFVISRGLLPKLTWSLDLRVIRSVLSLSIPRTLALSLSHVVTLVFVSLASRLTEGSISILNFAFNLQSVPLSIIGASYSLAAFPVLARHTARQEFREFRSFLSVAVRHIIFWSVPAMALFIMLRAQIVRVILGSGAFNWTDTRLTAACVALFAISVLAQGLSLLFIRAQYALGNTKIPVLVSFGSATLTVLLAFFFGAVFSADSTLRFFFESILRVENLPGTEVLAFPLAFSVGALFGTGLLYYSLKDSMREFIRDCSKTLVQVLSASVLMGQMIYLNLQFWSQFLNLNTFTGIFFQGALSALLGMFVFFLVLFGLQSTELEEIMASWRRRFTGVSPVGDELESGASV
jgi:putative peptidoglycan lipid II flippase